MGIEERRRMEKEIVKKKIIDAASEIMAEEGYENLSIRKIANKIEYSPGIIYHYFNDKAEIVASIVEKGSETILKSISEIPLDAENPEKSIEEGLRTYIELMLKAPEEFRAILMNNIDVIREKVGMLENGVAKEKKTIQGLCKIIEIGIEKGKFENMDIELTAQIIWTSTYGLLSRLILEKNIPKQQKERLVDHHFKILIKGLMK